MQRRLGAGNFATVYLAYDERLDGAGGGEAAVSDRWSWEPEVRGRFVQEARLLRSLNDPRVVQIRDIAETDDGRPYLVMDYATEGTLEQRMIELGAAQVQLGADAAAGRSARHRRRARRAARATHRAPRHQAVEHADHARRRRHHAPASVTSGRDDIAVLRPGERLMLGDLGLAKDLAFDSGVTVGVGTAGYMAPEQTLAGGQDRHAHRHLRGQRAARPDRVR